MSGVARAQWLVNRLRCMTVPELGYRLQQHLRKRLARAPAAMAPAASAAPRTLAVQGAPALPPGEREALLRDAAQILAGHVPLFAAGRADAGTPPQWLRDPATGVLAPAWPAHRIDITNRALVGDIKHLWELNRHLHLVRLAQAWALTGEAHWLDGLAAQLRSWLTQCPPGIGPNWHSPLELGIRLINWALLWQLAGGAASPLWAGADGAALRADWLASVHAHCQAIARHLSRHSSANNHLIGELAGLYVASATWPCWPASARWQAQARRELETQALAQFSSDGVNREQAFAYHVFAAEFLFVAGLMGQAAGQPFSRGYWAVLQRALAFLRAVRDAGGHVPMVGDADDGAVFRLAAQTAPAAQLVALGAAVLDGADGARADPGVAWLLHALPGPRPAIDPHVARAPWAFPDGGYLLFGARFGQPDEIKGLVDCGPLGYLGIAAHGHADALSVLLSVCGEPCLIDAGTYDYWQARVWRDYFRGTAAHNTARVDGLDQSVPGGRFLWLRKARASIERMPQSPEDFDFRGAHDGYARLPDPLRHTRSVRFDAASASLQVRDSFAARRPHAVELFWHFAPGLEVRLDGDAALHVRGRRFTLQLQVRGQGLTLALVRGALDPPLGWVAPRYGDRQPCDVLRITTVSCAVPIDCNFTIHVS